MYYNIQCLNRTAGLLWIFYGVKDTEYGHRGRYSKLGKKNNNKIPIVAYRHVLITARRLTPRARDFKQLGRLDLGSPVRQHTGYADTVRNRARRVVQHITASRTGFDFITVRLRFPSPQYLPYSNIILSRH